jgi:uracil-DNA glycosylase
MSGFAIGLLSFPIMLALLCLRIPIGVAMLLVGMGGYALMSGWSPLINFLKSEPYRSRCSWFGCCIESARVECKPMRDKHARLLELARLRQQAKWPRDKRYRCIGDYDCGLYECDFVSPYTIGAQNVDTELMILLQDWAPDDRLSGPFLPERCTVGHDPSRRTNRRRHELLLRHFALELEEVYATNVFPFIKVHKIQPEDFVRAAEEFALPQIKIVEPRLAVCLGKAAFNAVSVAASRSDIVSRAATIKSPFWIGKTQVWRQAHPARKTVAQVAEDWARMASEYKRRLQ